MYVLSYPVVALGVDYVSLSYPVSPVRVTDQWLAMRLGITDGDRVESQRLYGYSGWRAAGRYVGVRDDRQRQGWYRVLEIASGSGALTHDLAAAEDAVVNRLDIQATVTVCRDVDPMIAVSRVNAVIASVRDHVANYARHAVGHMRRLSHTWVESVRDMPGVTLYIGSRSSDVLVRVYNKTAEAGISDGSGLLRVEVELKDQYAARARLALLAGTAPASVLSGLLQRYNIDLGIAGESVVVDHRLARRDTDRTLRWLRESVSKTLQRLMVEDGLDKQQLIDILFHDSSDSSDDA